MRISAFSRRDAGEKHSQLKVVNINLLQAVVDYLAERNFIDKAIQMQKAKGDEALLKTLKGPLHMDKFAPHLVSKYATNAQDIVLMTGVGSVWPLYVPITY